MTNAPATTAPSCPKCGSEMYDNRATKKNPKQPDFKCKRYKTGCEGVIWPAKAPQAEQPRAPLALVSDAHVAGRPVEELHALFNLYDCAMDHVLTMVVPTLAKRNIAATPEVVASIAATLFIAGSKQR
jgi:hypothetical protein